MSCQINYNTQGGIANVFNSVGEEAKAFKQLAKLPHITTLEKALEVYKNLYTDKLNNIEKENPILEFTSDRGVIFNTYAEALKDSIGGDITISVNGNTLLVTTSNTNPTTFDGLINSLIKAGIMSDERIIEDGKSYLKADGYDQSKQIINEEIIKEETLSNLNTHTIKVTTDGRIDIQEKPTVVQNEFEKIVSEIQPSATNISTEPVLEEKDLKARLLEFLNDIGVTVTTIENYENKSSVPTTAEGLADIANQIVAFREGTLDTALVSEETAHFIVEGWNEQEIENLLRNIHKTTSYQEFSEHYREIYSRENPTFSSEELEKMVRKEILGKELASALQNRFSTEGKTEIQATIFSNLYKLLIKFFDSINLISGYDTRLNDLSDKVMDMLIKKDYQSFLDNANFATKKFRYYNSNQANPAQKTLVLALLEQEKALKSTGRGSSATIKKLEELISLNLEKSAVQNLTNIAKRQSKYIKEAIAAANKKGVTLSNEENIVFQNLKLNIRPALAQLRTSLQNDSFYKNEVEEMRNVLDQITDNEGANRNSENEILDQLIDRLMKRHNLEDRTIQRTDANGQAVELNVRQHLKDSVAAAAKDTSMLYTYFGQITHSSDPLLNLLGSVVGDMYTRAGHDYMKRAKDFQRELRNNGFVEKDLKNLMQEDGYIISKWDFAAYNDFLMYSKADAYKKHLPEVIQGLEDKISQGGLSFNIAELQQELLAHQEFSQLENEAFLEKFKKEKGAPIISDEIMRNTIGTTAYETINQGTETVLSEKYKKEQKEKFERLNISDEAKILMKGFSERRAQIKKHAKKTQSGVTYFGLQEKHELEALSIERRRAKSIYNTDTGKLKDGIVEVQEGTPNSVKVGDIYVALVSQDVKGEGRIAFDFNNLEQDFIQSKLGGTEERLDKTKHANFFADLSAMENDAEMTREEVVDFFNLNTQTGFSKEFWDSVDGNNIFDTYANDEEIADDIAAYKELLRRRQAILKEYKDPNNGVNTLAENIPQSKKEEIINLSNQIDDLTRGIFMYLRGLGVESSQLSDVAESGANEAYFGALKDFNLTTFTEQLEFTLKNMTDSNRRKVNDFYEAVRNGDVNTYTKYDNITARFGEDEQAVLRYAQSKLAPYYVSFAPNSLRDFYNGLRNSNEKVSDLLDKLNQDPNVRISVSFDYLDNQQSDILNPNKTKDFKGGGFEPKLNMTTKPVVFGKEFDFNNKKWSEIENSVKNKKLHDLYIKFQEETLESLNLKGDHNVYLAPQLSKTKMEGINKLFKGKNTRETVDEWIQEARNFRVDELVQGEEIDGKALYSSGLRVIPKYYINPLETMTDVSTDLFYSSMMMAHQAELHKQRKQSYSEFAVLSDAMEQRSYANGKTATAANSYKMFKSQMDYALFGVQEIARLRVNIPIMGQTDLTKTIKWIHKWKQNLALAITPIVPLTSMFTAQSQLIMERYVKQYIDPNSANKAMAEFRKIGGKTVNETFNINSKERLSILGEYFGIFDLDNRFRDSQYNVAGRFLGKAMYIQHTAGNFLPLSQGLLSVLYGHRVYAGKLVDFNQYMQISNAQGISKKDAENKWKELNTMYDYIKTDNGTVEYDSKIYADLGGITQEEFRNLELGVVAKGKKIVERIDGQIKPEERTMLQRHFLGTFLMSFKGWLSISTSNRFKNGHLNLQTGQWEEGSYKSLGKYMFNVINMLAKADFTGLKEVYMNSTDTERLNIQRCLKELGGLTMIFMLYTLAKGWGDDEPENALAQFSAYMSHRLYNETLSSQQGIIGEYYNTAVTPIVGIEQLKASGKVWEAWSGEEITKGRYAGYTEAERWWLKNLVGAKTFNDLSSAKNLKAQRDSYAFFNKDSEYLDPIALLYHKITGGEAE